MSGIDPRRTELLSLLNAGLTIRKDLARLRSAADADAAKTRDAAGQLTRIAAAAKSRALALRHEHGSALAEELSLAAQVHMWLAGESAPDESGSALEAQISAVLNAAKAFGDVQLALRALELLALAANLAGETWKEVHATERAVAIARTPQAVVSLLGAQWRLIEAANISLVTATAEHGADVQRLRDARLAAGDVHGAETAADDAPLESETQRKLRETLLEHNIRWWNELQWLAARPREEFDVDEFLRRFRTPAFAVCVYVGTMLANPFVGGGHDGSAREEDTAASHDAFEMAARVATLTDDAEALCVAAAHKVRAYFGRASETEQKQMVAELRALEEAKHPQAEDIRELLQDIEKQQGTFPQTPEGHQKMVEQLQLFRQRQQQLRRLDEPQ